MDAIDPAVALLDDGSRILVYAQNSDIWAQRFTPQGLPEGDAFLVTGNIPDFQAAPEAAALENGDVAVSWLSGTSTVTGDVVVQVIRADGSLTGEVNVSEGNAARFTEITTLGTPEGGTPSSAGFAVVWQEINEDQALAGVYGRVFGAGGAPLGAAAFRVGSPEAPAVREPDVIALSDGGFLVAYEEGQTGIGGQRYDAGGLATGGSFTISTEGPSDKIKPQFIEAADGTVTAFWLQGSNPPSVHFRKIGSDGAPAGKDAALSPDLTPFRLSKQDETGPSSRRRAAAMPLPGTTIWAAICTFRVSTPQATRSRRSPRSAPRRQSRAAAISTSTWTSCRAASRW